MRVSFRGLVVAIGGDSDDSENAADDFKGEVDADTADDEGEHGSDSEEDDQAEGNAQKEKPKVAAWGVAGRVQEWRHTVLSFRGGLVWCNS
jgi:hypothetical protein